MIRTCLFDMGNVLLHFCHDRMCRQMGALCGKTGDEIRRQLIDTGVQWDFERGKLSAAEFHQRFQDDAGVQVDCEQLLLAASDIFTVNEPMRGVLAVLRQQGMRLVLFSNTSVWHYQFIRQRYDILELLDEYVLSFEVQAIKPEPGMYEAGLRAIGRDPRECL